MTEGLRLAGKEGFDGNKAVGAYGNGGHLEDESRRCWKI